MAAATLILPELLEIPPGTFMMGSEGEEFDESPPHRVTVDGFHLARYPVTNEEYASYLAATGIAPPRFWYDEHFSVPGQPVVGVTWFEAVAYCAWVAGQTALPVRLPTEAEHEWAATGGLPGARYPWGDELPLLVGSWALGSAGLDRPQLVSSDRPNGYGLCHICDNVHEWCSDWWDPHYYADSPARNPQGPPTGARRASRGGSWRHYYKFSRCAARSSLDPCFRYNDYGFRVAWSRSAISG